MATTTTTTASVTETETEQHHEDDKSEDDNDGDADVVESPSRSVSTVQLLTSSGLNNNNKNNTSSSKSVKKPNLDKVVEKINHNNKKEITSISSCNSISVNNNNNSRNNFKMSDLIGNDEKELNGNHSEPEMADEEDEADGKSEAEDHHESAQAQHNATAALAAAQQLMGANPAMFNPAMFPTGQAFQNVVAQFTANAVANNMDMDNVALLKSALFTLQQQQFLQFQLIQHLHSQLLRNNGGSSERGVVDENAEAERSETESEILAKRDEDAVASRRASSANKSLAMQYDSPLKRLEEQSARQELDLR